MAECFFALFNLCWVLFSESENKPDFWPRVGTAEEADFELPGKPGAFGSLQAPIYMLILLTSFSNLCLD